MNPIQIPVPVTLVIPSDNYVLITAVRKAEIYPSGYVELTYIDGYTEGAVLDPGELNEGRDNFLKLVSNVQYKNPAQE